MSDLVQRDQQVLWHPYTQASLATDPILIVKGEGIYLYDEHGKKYIDAVGSWWVNCHGHAHPQLIEALQHQAQQLEHVIFAGFTHEVGIELATALLKFAGQPFSRVFYSDNGSTAVEVALKMALQYFSNKQAQRFKIIAYKNSYHGDTFGAMSVSARSIFTAAFNPLLFEVVFIDAPYEGNENQSLNQLAEVLEQEEAAAFIFEPLIQGAGGMLTYSAKTLDEQIALCKSFNVITIADEVFTGFYRTGKPLAIHHLKNEVDIICLSKALSGGMMPFGATLAAEFIYNAFLSDDRSKTFFHGHSFTGNPLACAVSLASLKLFDDPNYIHHIAQLCKSQNGFIQSIATHEAVKSARCCGIIAVVEFNSTQNSGYLNASLGDAFHFFLERNILIRPLGNVIYLVPPYAIQESELNLLHQVTLAYADYFNTKLNGETAIQTSENFD